MTDRTRLDPKERRDQILTAALELAALQGYENVRRGDVAKSARVSPALVTHYFRTVAQLQRAIMREAVTRADITVIAQGLARKDKQALKAPHAVRVEAAISLTSD